MLEFKRSQQGLKKGEQGFTLIELSIVLVIIGLIVGGVLVGQDLIKAAEIRATVSQIEKYNTAVNTFRGKYNGLPGDLSNAATFGFATRTSAAGRGDGNGLIEGGGAGNANYGGETALFWSDLSTANLVDGNFTGADSAGTAITAGSTTSTMFPSAKLGRGNSIMVFPGNANNTGAPSGYNYFFLGIVSSATSSLITTAAGLSPNQAYNMDKKVDDGLPLSGTVQTVLVGAQTTVSGANIFTVPDNTTPTSTVGASVCEAAATPVAYNVSTTNTVQDKLLCNLSFRFN